MSELKRQGQGAVTENAARFAAVRLGVVTEKLEILPVNGGYSLNRRALVGADDAWIFVKEVDIDLLPGEGQEELWWLKKDFLCTEALRSKGSSIVAAEASLDDSGHILAMTAYRAEDGWLWFPPEDRESRSRYIDAVITATDKIELLTFSDDEVDQLKLQPYFRDELAMDEGIELILNNEAIRAQLIEKYESYAMNEADGLSEEFEQMVELLRDESWLTALRERGRHLVDQPNDTFAHCDVRSDNLAVNLDTGEVKFVDWNWASYATKGFGATEFLTDMARRGTDISPWIGKLNVEMLAATVGFYARRCLGDPLTPGSTLRRMQAESAAVAYALYRRAIVE